MSEKYLVPLKMKPFCRETLWGGQRLRDDYHKPAPADLANIAESWEISTHPNGMSCLEDGSIDAKTFADYLWQAGPRVISPQSDSTEFPLIIKYIDAADTLSIQVHPGPGFYTTGPNRSGKTEMWYVVDATPGAYIYYGVKEITDRATMRQALDNDTLPELLRRVEVHPGDFFFIPPGTIHAIGAGILIAEIQQACDVTFRVCDYGRIDASGKKRPLHIKEALMVSNLNPTPMVKAEHQRHLTPTTTAQTLVTCPHFQVTRVHLDGKYSGCASKASFQVIMCLDGHFNITHENMIYTYARGETAFLPAGLGDYMLEGEAELLTTQLPPSHKQH